MLYKSITTTTLAVALAASATAQSVDIPTNIAENLLGFRAQNLIPRPVESDEIDLTSALVLSFGGADATPGQFYTLPADQSTLADAPVFHLDVPEEYAQRYAQTNFTAIICDPGSITNVQPETQVTRHYLANGLRLVDGRLQETEGAITSYNAPGPAAGDGAHRYLALVFAQDEDEPFRAPAGLNGTTPLGNMSLSDYIDDADLGSVIALTFILVENTSEGTAPAASSTAVPSASVAAAASSIASSLGLVTGASTSAASTGTSSSAPASSTSASGGGANAAAPAGLAGAGAHAAAMAALLGAAGVALGAWAL